MNRTGVVLAILLVSCGLIGVGLADGLPASTLIAAEPAPAAPSVRPTLSATPSPTPTKPAMTPVVIPSAESTRLAIPEISFSVATSTLTVGKSGVITPPDFVRVFRVADRGVMPGTDAKDTVYYACHTHSKLTPAEVPCNGLQGNVKAGHHVVVTTGNGVLSYLITSVRQVPKSDLAKDYDVWVEAPGRLILITCLYEPGRTTGFNLVVTAEIEYREAVKQ